MRERGSKRGGLQPSMCYSNAELSRAKRNRIDNGLDPLRRDAIQQLTAEFNSAFEDLPSDTQQLYIDEAAARRDVGRDVATPATRYCSSRRWGMSNINEPVSVDQLTAMFVEHAGSENGGGGGG